VVDASIAIKWVIPEVLTDEADTAFVLVSQSGIDLHPTGPLLRRAMEVARRLDHPVSDCVYLALAEREHAVLVTADQRLLRRLSARKLGVSVVDLRTV
jgi:predicted nucleic acid-binding protein